MSRFSQSNRSQKMFGSFIVSPPARECCGYCWRGRSGKYKNWAKQALSSFRRRDGKRFVLEALATIREEQADEQDRLKIEYQQYLDDLNHDPDDYDDYPYEYGPDPEFHDDGAGIVDYTAEAEWAYEQRREMAYQELDYQEDYLEWYLENIRAEAYDYGYRKGYRDSMNRPRDIEGWQTGFDYGFDRGFQDGYSIALAEMRAEARQTNRAS